MGWLFLILAIFSEVIATSALKAVDGFKNLYPSIIVILGYGTSFFFLSLTLKSIPVGIAYAIWAGVGIFLVSLAGYFLYKQSLDFPAIFGILLIISGVAIIRLFSKSGMY